MNHLMQIKHTLTVTPTNKAHPNSDPVIKHTLTVTPVNITHPNSDSALTDDDVTLDVAFGSSRSVLWIPKNCPLVVELVICSRQQSM